MLIDTAHNFLLSDVGGCKLPLVSKRGHLFFEWTDEILYTTDELRKIHRHFLHPKSERLYAVMRLSDQNSCSPQDLRQLQEIASKCDVCQRLSRAPSRFRVSLPWTMLSLIEYHVLISCIWKVNQFYTVLTGTRNLMLPRFYQMKNHRNCVENISKYLVFALCWSSGTYACRSRPAVQVSQVGRSMSSCWYRLDDFRS